ncbi:MAG TPA: fumarate hydratase, partial [Candidatus Marinimicrobia bacterium]|nr:fumarate hydratase [Candidatus Neomarinimicrobiota bacterium]
MVFNLDSDKFRTAVLELIRRTSTNLSPDVVQAITDARDSEEENSSARGVLTAILKNIERACEKSTPICQDTGTNIYYVTVPEGLSMRKVSEIIYSATKVATEKVYLRPNA